MSGFSSHPPYLCILDDKVSRGIDQSHQRGREQHLDNGDIAIVTRKDLGERIRMVDPEASRRACTIYQSPHHHGRKLNLPTARQL